MDESGIMIRLYSAAIASRKIVSPGLTWLNTTGRSPISIPAGGLARHREGRGREIAGLREIGPEMRAAGILALERGERNDPAHLAQRAQIEPIVPGQIEAAVGIGDAGRQKFRLDAVDRRDAALDARPVAHHADLVPHRVEQLFAQRVEIAAACG